MPSEASVFVAPIMDEEIIHEKINFWNDMKSLYDVDMSCLKEFARKSFVKEVSPFGSFYAVNLSDDVCLHWRHICKTCKVTLASNCVRAYWFSVAWFCF